MSEQQYASDAKAIHARARSDADAAWARFLAEMNTIGQRAVDALAASARKNGMRISPTYRVTTRETQPDIYKPQLKLSDGLWYTG